MRDEFKKYVPVAKAIVALFHPFVEVVIHDLETQNIVAIFNNYSKRDVGDSSFLEEKEQFANCPDILGPYYKTNRDGRRLKSTTATIKDNQGQTIGLLCINFAIGAFDEMHDIIASLTGAESESSLPKELFSQDWREKVSHFVHAELKANGKNLKSLNKEDKRLLVQRLHQEGAFKAKHAAQFVGDILDLSRATVYKYLAQINGKGRDN